MSDPDCLFCRIIAGEIPSDMVVETETVVAFRDINPKAPTHVLVVPRMHVEDVEAVASADPLVLAEMMAVARRIAETECGGEYRLIFNTGVTTGQTVAHAHGHVLGGAQLGWNPA